MDGVPLYIESAIPLDVMVEQLYYLFSHASPSCGADCSDCLRLANVESLLLAPFTSVIRQKSATMSQGKRGNYDSFGLVLDSNDSVANPLDLGRVCARST